MEKLMKPAEYAKELGISRQAVYAKIKRGILAAKNVDGKLYIVVDKESKAQKTPVQTMTQMPKTNAAANEDISSSASEIKEYKALLAAKDETISVLKGTVKDLKKSNKQISTTLKGEIDLLKEAFYEMRALYVHQLEHKKTHDAIDIMADEEMAEVVEERWISIKKFFKQEKVTKDKHREKAAKRLKKAYKSGDKRLMKVDGELKLNASKNYEDILN
ncbi:DUF3972 domain-containing protein [Sulfurovum sp.]|uniref:DUF3972 domain-containing protein n=1 Tax=Sulfurovum sp. TaxID=1969726 RepID=UPI0025D5E869|nr:DUF3972 domain-containing protein [Sulfurovum sp.]